jgi:hypothetical protein
MCTAGKSKQIKEKEKTQKLKTIIIQTVIPWNAFSYFNFINLNMKVCQQT